MVCILFFKKCDRRDSLENIYYYTSSRFTLVKQHLGQCKRGCYMYIWLRFQFTHLNKAQLTSLQVLSTRLCPELYKVLNLSQKTRHTGWLTLPLTMPETTDAARSLPYIKPTSCKWTQTRAVMIRTWKSKQILEMEIHCMAISGTTRQSASKKA